MEERRSFQEKSYSLLHNEILSLKLLASSDSTGGKAIVLIASLAAMIKYPDKTNLMKEGLPWAHSWRLQSAMIIG